MTTLDCNHDAGGNFDVLTDEHSACSYGQPVLIHYGRAHGPADQYSLGVFGYCLAKDAGIQTSKLLTDDQVALVKKWETACKAAGFAALYPEGMGGGES